MATLRLLILEDNPADAELVERELRKDSLTFSVTRVETKEAFVKALEDDAPDLILSDYSLPTFDGLTALAIARERCPEVPFILVSGTVGEEIAIESLKAGATDYVLKHRLSRLVPAVQRAIKEAEDVRARRQAEEELKAANLKLIQAEKLESVGRLAAGIAHEVKNPLSVILMGADYLSARLAGRDEQAANVLSQMTDAAKRADTVIRGLLDFAASRKVDLKSQALNAVVEQALALVKHELVRAQIKAVKDLAAELPPLQLDGTKIEQVLVNLFMNAIDAMPTGGTLTVRTSVTTLTTVGSSIGRRNTDRFKLGDPVAVVEVSDTGTGVPEAHLSKLFDPFFTTKPPGKGTGLGLSVTMTIIELHEGAIDIRNRPEGGAQVTLMFPVQRRPSP